ncbi:MAG TPA: helix-turn-helix transcriptional regulator [Bryobacteraceae bacterium]|jgi:cytoskeletal protein RodZ
MKEELSVLGLATIRRNRGISLEQIANSTKISVRSLEAIERGDFHKLPGGIYNTSYIRQYARAIDYDESAILAVYHQKMGTTETTDASGKTRGDGLFGGGYRPASTTVGS